MKIFMTGASGLIGSALTERLTADGHAVTRLVRSEPKPVRDEVRWDPDGGTIDAASLEGFDAAIHLAGESVAEGKWTPEKKIRIRDSRVKGTALVAETIAGLASPPKTFLSASAVGYYGHRDDEVLRESVMPGMDFLARVCREWENAAEPAAAAGVRVVYPRFGVVLSSEGGALAKMLPPFRLGLGGKLGSGEQYMSWIAIEDAVGALVHALATEGLSGPVNVVAPNPVTNAEFTETLGRVLGRPTVFGVPEFALRFLFGELADAALLASQRAKPERLVETNFPFQYPELEPALRHLVAG